MGNWSDNDRNAAAERELDNDLDHYFESMEDGPEVEQTYTVSIDVSARAVSKDEAKKLVQNSLINNYRGLTVYAINITDAYSEDDQ